MPTSQVVVDKGEFGFEPLLVVFAESLTKTPWWRYHTLTQGNNSWDTLEVDDPDNFCVYNFSTKKIVWMLSSTPARGGHIFRIHNGVKARIRKRDDESAFVTATGGIIGKDGVHQCVGTAVSCAEKTDLRIDSLGLKFPWELPKHLQYKSKKSIEW
ncbi:MAG: hypothetical protein AB7G75_32385 [Candidatus Binatia bacterium]